MERGLKWAADGDESLGRAWIDFAQNYVLKGPVDACGNRTPYGARYNGCPLSDSPYANQALEYGLPASRIDLKNAAVKPLGDEDIAKWSIQFYEILPPARPKVSVVVRTPRTWFPAKGKSRAVFVRPDAKAEVVAMKAVDAAPLSSPSAYAVLPTAGTPVYAYVVDTGQTGSGWVYSNDEAAIFVLEPPQNVKSELQGNRQKITWTEPPVAATKEVLSGYRIYETGGMSPLGFVKAGTASFDFEIEGSAKAIELTSAIEVGKAEDGALLYIESERSDPVGSAGAGNYEMCLDLTSEILKVGDSCDSMFPDWQFPSMQPCFDVAVGPDGRFNFHHEWKGKFREGQTHLLDGEGSFVGSVLRIKGTFRNDASWTNGLSKFEQTDSGPFSGEGKYIGDVWFGTKLEGTFESSITRHFCKNSNEGCTEWEDKSLSCSGKIPSYVSSIPKFERK
jgi:hypothetical protein